MSSSTGVGTLMVADHDDSWLSLSCCVTHQILSIEMHRGLRPLGAGALSATTQAIPAAGEIPDGGASSENGGEALEGSRAAAKAVEGFIRKNIEAYFGIWTSTYTLFSLDPRLVSA